jgi:hypothetical protein
LNRQIAFAIALYVLSLTASGQVELRVYSSGTPQKLLHQTEAEDSTAAAGVLLEFQRDDQNSGCFFAGYDSVSYSDTAVKAWYHRGEFFHFGAVNMESETDSLVFMVDTAALMSQPASPDLLNQWLQKSQKRLNKRYPMAQVMLDSMQTTAENELILFLRIVKSNERMFNGFVLPGFDEFPITILKSAGKLKDGGLYNAESLQALDESINMLEFAELSAPWYLTFTDSTYRIVVPLKENKASRFSGIAGILPGDDNANLYLTGQLDLQLVNAFSQAERLVLSWEAPEKQSQNLNLALEFPVLFKGIGIDVGFTLEKKDTSFVNTRFRGGLSLTRGFGKIGLFYTYDMNNALGTSDRDSLSDVQSRLAGLSWTYRRLDYLPNPRKGQDIRIMLAAGTRNTNQRTNDFKAEASLVAMHYQPLSRRMSLKLSLHGGIVAGDSLFRNEYFRLGGDNLFRSYRSSAFWTPWYGQLGTEILFYPDKKSAVFAFVQTGIVKSEYGILRGQFNPFSVGIGTLIDTNFGGIRLYYGVGRTTNAILDLRQSRIGIGYVNNF